MLYKFDVNPMCKRRVEGGGRVQFDNVRNQKKGCVCSEIKS